MYEPQRQPAGRLFVDVLLEADSTQHERQELLSALAQQPPRIPSRYFYDARGSELFERITELPEYYQTRAERALLETSADRVAAAATASELVEIGSGAATKTRILLDAMERAGLLGCYVPFDVDESVVRRVGEELVAEYPGLMVHGVVGNFLTHLDHIPRHGRRLIAFLGGTIGNLRPAVAADFVRSIGSELRAGEHLLLGTDLIKDPDRLEAAYNDSQGVTAEFNRNILNVVNERFGGDFDPDAYAHRAIYDRHDHWIEMHLVARTDQRVTFGELGTSLEVAAGTYLLTEISAKYDRHRCERLLAAGGLELESWLVDGDNLFGLSLARKP